MVQNWLPCLQHDFLKFVTKTLIHQSSNWSHNNHWLHLLNTLHHLFQFHSYPNCKYLVFYNVEIIETTMPLVYMGMFICTSDKSMSSTFFFFLNYIYIYIYCKDRIWYGPKLGLDFSPISPNNEFIENGWKNYFYSRRKSITIAVLRALNINKIRNNGPRHDQRS